MEPGAYIFRNLVSNMLVGGEPSFQAPVTLVHGSPGPIILHPIGEDAFIMLPALTSGLPLHVGCENNENSPIMFKPEPCPWIITPGPIPDTQRIRCQNADLYWTAPEDPSGESPVMLQKDNGGPTQLWRLERA